MKTCSRFCLLALLLLTSFYDVTAATYITSKIWVSGDPQTKAGVFYGYQKSTNGPGDDAFQKCLSLARKEHRPFLWIWGRDNCAGCSAFAQMVNKADRDISSVISLRNIVAGYFRGSDDGTRPRALSLIHI